MVLQVAEDAVAVQRLGDPPCPPTDGSQFRPQNSVLEKQHSWFNMTSKKAHDVSGFVDPSYPLARWAQAT